MRIFEGVYKLKGMTIAGLASWIAEAQDNHAEFNGIRTLIVAKFVDAGTRHIRMYLKNRHLHLNPYYQPSTVGAKPLPHITGLGMVCCSLVLFCIPPIQGYLVFTLLADQFMTARVGL